MISLSLMVLLTVLAVGLLGLSSLSLSGSARDSYRAEAKANARLALSLAIAQLQKHTGPDQRITVPADQLSSGGDGGQSDAAEARHHWTGVYDSWTSTSTERPDPRFLTWLVSGDRKELENPATARTTGDEPMELVGEGTVGTSETGRVEVTPLRVASSGGGSPRIAWWTGDQGVKAAMATPPPADDASYAALRAGLQTAPRNAVEIVATRGEKPFGSLQAGDTRLTLVTDWKQSSLLASDPTSTRELFHDIAPFSTGLLTNVRAGGFRKDLSMQLERPSSMANTLLASNRTALYRVGGENGINLHELWAYYNLYKDLRTSGSARYTTGGTIPSGTPYLQMEPGPEPSQTDDEFYFKQPVITSYQMVLSFETRPNSSGRPILHVVADPVLTFWNPLDVPVVVPVSSFFSVKYWQIPYDLVISVNGQPSRQCPLIRSFSGSDGNFLSLVAGRTQQLVFKPGEVIKVAQSGNLIVRAGASTDHNLAASTGFNFQGGVSYPVRDMSGANIEVPSNARITYEARPNGYTAGAASGSGMVPPGYDRHTRHFSLSHHEVYIGADRGDSRTSLGIGGIYVDWDFGNRRLKPSENRGTSAPGIAGTKPSNQRLYANKFPQVFKTLTQSETRQLAAADISGRKAPVMIISYNAKTEGGTDAAARTRYLGRFNPKAHHVDFYDLSQRERDILPYEFSVEALSSWKNRSIEVSPDGSAFFGGGMNAQLGSNFVTTHSVPREPIVSLAALQHSFANGFEILRPKHGYGTLNSREPLYPQISHAIGNSVAPPMLAPDKTEGSLGAGRPLADHSYLANHALWDEWFFSGIAPQDRATFAQKRSQKQIASEFFDGEFALPVARFLPDTGGVAAKDIVSTLFSGAVPTDLATRKVASLIRVEGLFNVNSTSVEAWKAMLGSLKDRKIMVSAASGAESASGVDAGDTPVAGLLTPRNLVAESDDTDLTSPAQWTGRRVLSEEEIDSLAQGIVKEVRKRGPFLSLADFINRRPGNDEDLARAGAIQSALDSEEVKINAAYQSGDRAISSAVSGRFAFPEAEEGPSGYGAPGIVKQADILTPIAPVLSARSDSFIIRTYGESVDKDGKVLARAWCEAVVERNRNFIDPADAPETPLANLKSGANEAFGRRYELTSFRWLHPDEI